MVKCTENVLLTKSNLLIIHNFLNPDSKSLKCTHNIYIGNTQYFNKF